MAKKRSKGKRKLPPAFLANIEKMKAKAAKRKEQAKAAVQRAASKVTGKRRTASKKK